MNNRPLSPFIIHLAFSNPPKAQHAIREGLQITPQFLLVVSAASFALSYFPMKKDFNLYLLKSVRETYQSWLRWKLIWHYLAFGFFIAGLLAIAMTS
jgi:hypothetical protein